MRTHEGAFAFEHTLNHALEYFSKAGSVYKKKKGSKGSFYGKNAEESALSLFQKAWIVDPLTTFKIMLYIRDCRGGAGNRSATRECLTWLAHQNPAWIATNIGWIPLVGRWDDLKSLFKTPLERLAAEFWAKAIRSGDVLAAKWAKREYIPLQKAMNTNEAGLRHVLAEVRKQHIVEFKMCERQWREIEYSHVPSVAMARYTNAFGKNDADRFEAYKAALEKGETKIHANVLFPHDCVRTALAGDKTIADAQFNALPNFMAESDERIMAIADTSGSMDDPVSGGGMICRVHVSQGLALYCSSRIPEGSPFHKKFIGFCHEGRFVDWSDYKFSQAIFERSIFNRAVGSTRIDTALDLILRTAKFFVVPQNLMPTMLLIISDMQFHEGSRSGDGTEVERCLVDWEAAGYKRPKVVYWNVAGYAGSQATALQSGVALISGFSTGALTALFNGQEFTPLAIMERAIEKYKVVAPE